MDELLDNAPCGYLALADDGTILLINATLARWLGHGAAELTGRHIDAILPAGGRIFYQTHLFPLLRVQGRAEEVYLSLCCKNGDVIPMLVNAVRRPRDAAFVNECSFVPMRLRRRHEDEILKAKKAADAANEAKSKFLSMMSHDLRTPLQSILLSEQVLRNSIRGPVNDAQRQELERIARAGRELMGLLTDILDFARLDTGRVGLDLRAVGVAAALERAEALLAPQLAQAELHYAREDVEAGLEVRADPDRLQQILLNLLGNALKFTPAGGRVTTAVERAGGRAVIHVRDTGPGIEPEQIEQIFEPFVQGDRETSRATRRGVGLGLAISRELARAMGGDLTVRSTLGAGAVFSVALDLAAQQGE